jgi:hypothetical protein
MFVRERPSTYASPVRFSAMTRAAAPANTGVPSATRPTSSRLTATGRSARPSVAASAVSTAYPATISGRARSRSVSEPSSRPPNNCGRKPAAKASALSSGDPVLA